MKFVLCATNCGKIQSFIFMRYATWKTAQAATKSVLLPASPYFYPGCGKSERLAGWENCGNQSRLFNAINVEKCIITYKSLLNRFCSRQPWDQLVFGVSWFIETWNYQWMCSTLHAFKCGYHLFFFFFFWCSNIVNASIDCLQVIRYNRNVFMFLCFQKWLIV